MSVYKPAKSRFFHFDFVAQGRRFHGSTGCETRRKAEAVERRKREDAALGRADPVVGPGVYTLDQAAGRWWAEVGRLRKDAAKLEARVDQLVALFKPTTRLIELDTAAIAEAIERRRGRAFRRSPKTGAKMYFPANATVNRDVIETLRPIVRRARTHWTPAGASSLPEIDWRSLRLSEPRELVRVYSPTEQTTWLDACHDPATRLALELMLTYGLRYGELFFPPPAFEPAGPRLAWTKGRKGDVPHTVPLLHRHAVAIASRVGRAVKAALPHIFFVDAKDARGRPMIRALTYAGLEARISGAADRAGITPGRRIHGLRHHAGTRILRQTGNLKTAQRLLGHVDIASTMRYVHTVEDELRAALEAADESRNSPEPATEPEAERRSIA